MILLLLACNGLQPLAPDCDVESTILRFAPICERAELERSATESRLVLPGDPGNLTVLLPAELEATAYGGEGAPIEATVTINGEILQAKPGASTVTFTHLGPEVAESDLDLDFGADGVIQGPLSLAVSQGE